MMFKTTFLDSLERAVRAFAQIVAALFVIGGVGLSTSAVGAFILGPFLAFVLSILTSLAGEVSSEPVGARRMWSSIFWREALERAGRTAIAFLISLLIGLLWPSQIDGFLRAILIAGTASLLQLATFLMMNILDIREQLDTQQSLTKAAELEVAQADKVGQPSPHSSETGVAYDAGMDARARVRYTRARAVADVEVRRYLPPNPRTAKRMVNAISLAMAIANERGVFYNPDITPEHLKKWIGIVEQWPQLGAALTGNPSGMTALESAHDIDDLAEVLAELAPTVTASEALQQRLRDGWPLAPVLSMLVRFQAD